MTCTMARGFDEEWHATAGPRVLVNASARVVEHMLELDADMTHVFQKRTRSQKSLTQDLDPDAFLDVD